jgi:hypothetical protein
VVGGLAMRALDKLYGQPYIVGDSLTTKSTPSARSFLSVPVVSGQTKSAQHPLHRGQKSTRMRYQGLIGQCGSVTIGLGVYSQLVLFGRTSGIIYFTPSCINKKCTTSTSIVS